MDRAPIVDLLQIVAARHPARPFLLSRRDLLSEVQLGLLAIWLRVRADILGFHLRSLLRLPLFEVKARIALLPGVLLPREIAVGATRLLVVLVNGPLDRVGLMARRFALVDAVLVDR